MQKVQGWAEQGGQITVGGVIYNAQKAFPGCTIDVYATGTLIHASLFSDDGITPQANPFTADDDASWSFYVADGAYDIRFSGTGITTPFTLSNIPVVDVSVVSDASDTVKGITKLSVAPVAEPIAVGDNDPRNSDARTPTGAAGGALAGTYPNPTLAVASIGGTLGATDNAIPRADGTGGVTAQGSLAQITDTGTVYTPAQSGVIIGPTAQSYASYSGASESGPGVFVHRTVASEASDNEHGFVDATQFGRANKAYAAFDSQPVFTGSNNYDHVSNFQARAQVNTSGILSRYYSFFSSPILNAGTVTDLYGVYIATPAIAGGASNTNRYAFVSESNAGMVGIGTVAPTNHRLTVGANETPIATSAVVGIYNAANCHMLLRDTAANIEAAIGTDGTGTFIGSNSNHQVAFVANNTVKATLTTSGQLILGGGAGTASASLELQSTTGAFIINKLTTAQKNALTASDGMMVYDTSLGKFQGRAGGAWVDLH